MRGLSQSVSALLHCTAGSPPLLHSDLSSNTRYETLSEMNSKVRSVTPSEMTWALPFLHQCVCAVS